MDLSSLLESGTALWTLIGGADGADGVAGAYGGGGGAEDDDDDSQLGEGNGGGGAVRIIWGTGRAFPSTRTADE